MTTTPLAARSLLFAPGDSPRKMEKAGLSAADLVIIDLEDAVAESAKAETRIAVAKHLKATHRRLYYVSKWATILGGLYLIFFSWISF